MADIPRYRCIKSVRALEINHVTDDDIIFFEIADDYPPKKVDPKFFARYRAKPGDFLVIYDDGYMSVSPREPFLKGYVREEV